MNRLNTGDTGKAITSSNDGTLYSGIMGDGQYVLSTGSQFKIEIQSNNLLKMFDGSALMQGRHVEIPISDSEFITINNGSQGMNRKDLIVFRYTKEVTGAEDVSVVVIEGEETSKTAQVPDYLEGNILNGDTQVDMPLYVVTLNGINIVSVTSQFDVLGTYEDFSSEMDEIKKKVSDLNSKNAVKNGVISWRSGKGAASEYISAKQCGKVVSIKLYFTTTAAIGTTEYNLADVSGVSMPNHVIRTVCATGSAVYNATNMGYASLNPNGLVSVKSTNTSDKAAIINFDYIVD